MLLMLGFHRLPPSFVPRFDCIRGQLPCRKPDRARLGRLGPTLVYPFIRSSVYPFIRLSVYPFIRLSVYPFIHLSVYPYPYPFIRHLV
jgi:hypothetical protein